MPVQYPPDTQEAIADLYRDIKLAESAVATLRDRANELIAAHGVSIKRTVSRLQRAVEYLYDAAYYTNHDGIQGRQVQTKAMKEATVEHELT